MSEDRVARHRRSRFGCLVWVLGLAAAAAGVVVAIGFIFDQGDSAKQPERGFDAGPADAYQPATVNYMEFEHLYVVRLQGGELLALYDKSPRQQEVHGDCRVSFQDNASLGALEPVPRITGGFVEDCTSARAVWRADGTFAFGASYGNLDRFDTHTDAAGNLIIDTDSRTCTRSRGVVGVPPFDETTCGRGD